jgi:hypothetical protein
LAADEDVLPPEEGTIVKTAASTVPRPPKILLDKPFGELHGEWELLYWTAAQRLLAKLLLNREVL